MQLVVDAMGAALRGGPEFRADAAQVNADTEQLASAFGVLFGPQNGTRFASVWGDHVEALVSYSGAVAAKDQEESLTFGPERHQGLDSVYCTRVENGRWVPVTDWSAAVRA